MRSDSDSVHSHNRAHAVSRSSGIGRDYTRRIERLDAIYDREFFRQYGRDDETYAGACELIGGELARRFAPATAIDWGCGTGLHVGALVRAGVDAIGVDAVIADPDLRDRDAVIARGDLRRPVERARDLAGRDGEARRGRATMAIPARCDLALSIDVLEHIDEADSAAALANICAGAGLVILSCAPPGQGGHHHVNEQPRRYWVRRMAAIGWSYQRRETGALERHFLERRDRLPHSWMYHNLCVYRPTD